MTAVPGRPWRTLVPADLDFEKGGGLITVVAQDARTGAVLMVAHADREAVERTLATGEMHYRSRTRGAWRKGETSGNVQRVIALLCDCDGDAMLARVVPDGPACHRGTESCFGGGALAADAVAEVDAVVADRARRTVEPGSASEASSSYTMRLLADRNLRLKKLGEEVAELVLACADENAARAAEEAADLLYHMLVALHGTGVSLDAVRAVLRERQRRAPDEDRPQADELG